MKKLTSIISIIAIGILSFAFPLNAASIQGPGGGPQVPIPVQYSGTSVIPNPSSYTLGSTSTNGAFNNITIGGTCSGSGCGGSSTSSVKYSVCSSGCTYSTLQPAMDSVSSTGGTILVGPGTYTISATTTFGGSDIHVLGVGDATVIQFNGSSTPYAFANNADGGGAPIHYRDELGFMKIVTTAVGQGVGILLDKFNTGSFHDLHIVDTNGGTYANGNQTFENVIDHSTVEPEGAGNYGFSFNGAANQNIVSNSYTIPSVTASTTGAIINGTAGIWLTGDWFQNASNGGIAVDIQTGSHNNSVINSWLENNYINVRIASGDKGNAIIASHLSVAALTDIQDNGGIGTFVQSLVNGGDLLAYGGDNVKLELGTDTAQSASGFNLYMVGGTTKEMIDIAGAGSSEVQSAMQLESNSALRGGGVFAFDSANSRKWYWGTCYNNNDSFCINRQTSANQTSTSAANPAGTNVTNLVTISNAGGLAISGHATSTGYANTSVTSALLKATSTGEQVAAVPGTDYSTGPSPEDSGFKAWDFDPVATVNTGTSVPTSTVFGASIVLKSPVTVTKVRFALIAAGVTTTNCFVGLYQNGTLVASSSDISTPLLSSLTQTATLNTTTTLSAGNVDIAALIGNASTSPQFIRGVSNSVANQITTRFWNASTSTTALPGTLGSKTAQSNSWWFALQ